MKKVLIVEDAPLVAENLRILMANAGYRVTAIISSFTQLESTLILLDIYSFPTPIGIFGERDILENI